MAVPQAQPGPGHRGGIPARRSRQRRAGQQPRRPASCPPASGARRPGHARAAAGAGRGRHGGLPRCRRRARGAASGCAAPSPTPRARTAWRSSPPPPIPPPPGPISENTDKERYRTLTEDYPGPGPAAGDQRHARPCRDRGRGPAHRPDEPGRLLPAPSPGAVDQLAVLGAARTPGSRRFRRTVAERPAPLGLARDASRAGASGSAWSRPWPRSG